MKRWKVAFSELKKLSFAMSIYRGLAPIVVMSFALTNVFRISAEWVIGMALVFLMSGGLFVLSLRFSNVNIPVFEANEDMGKIWVKCCGAYICYLL